MIINGIEDVKKLLTTAEVAEKFQIEPTNVFAACKDNRLTEDEAVNTPRGWLITPDGAARLWKPRPSIVQELSDHFVGKKWIWSMLASSAKKDIVSMLTTERKRKCVININKDRTHFSVEFKDTTVYFYNVSDKKNMFEVGAVSEAKETSILVSPRGLDDEVYKETYPSLYEAQKRIDSFAEGNGWAKLESNEDSIQPIGEPVK
jgi:hypothetical protein